MPIGNNPFQDGLSVRVGADTSAAERGLSSLTNSLGATRLATIALGGALAAIAVGGFAKSIRAAADWEQQLVEIAKVTDDATAAELDESLQSLSETLPVATSELADIAEIAGRLGIQGSENIEEFTTVTSKLAVATDLTARDAAQDFARLSNAMDVPIEQMNNMGSSVNTLANNFAASTSEIVESMGRAAPAAAQLGVEFDELAAFQTVLVASGMRVERAGTRMNRAFSRLSQKAPEVAEAVGRNADEFSRLLENDPTEALGIYLEHLSGIESSQERVNEATEIFGTAGAKAILTLATNTEDLDRAMAEANDSFREGESLNREYEQASQTFNAEVQRLENSIGNLAREIGEDALPAMAKLIAATADATNEFTDMLEEAKKVREETDMMAGGWKQAATDMREEAERTARSVEAVPESLAESEVDRFIADSDRMSAALSEGNDSVAGGAREAEKAISALIDTRDELREDVAGGLSLSNIRRLIEERLPRLMEQAGEGAGLSGQRASFAIALQNLQAAMGPDVRDISDLPVDALTTVARQLTQERRERQGTRQAVLDRLRGEGMFGQLGGAAFRGAIPTRAQRQIEVMTDTNVEVVIEGDDQGIIQIVDTRINEEKRTARRTGGSPRLV